MYDAGHCIVHTVKSCQKDRGLILSDLGSRPGLAFLTFFKIWFKARGPDKRNIFLNELTTKLFFCNFKKYFNYYYKPSIYYCEE